MIIRKKPYLILKIGNNVYKFLPSKLLAIETRWLNIKNNLNEFNKITTKSKLKIPTINKSPYYSKTSYLGKDLFILGSNIENSTGWKVWRREKGVSHNWSPETTFKYMLVQRRFIKPGKDQDIYHFMQRAKKVSEKENSENQ